jgi:predicted Fe-Mo cluster-binding NifX family protein
MKIAIPTKNKAVDDHFGHCEAYTIVSLDEKQIITATEILPAPQGCGCKSNIASVLQEKGVGLMLAGNMGTDALNVLSKHGIKVYRGCSGDITQLLETFLKGKIADSGEGCQHHNEPGAEHTCAH